MNENLITVAQTMSSLQIAELTGKRHDAILRDIRNLLEQGVNAHNFVEVEYSDKKGELRPCFNLTKKGCLILASGYNALLREKIIDRWEELESGKATPTAQLSRKELALMVIQAEEEKERLTLENSHLQRQNAKLQPKADFADTAFATDSKVDIGMTAKILKLGFGRNTLFKKLKGKGILFGSRNEPKQKYVDAGYFELTEKFIERNEHPGFVVTKVLVTQKGLSYINNIFNGKRSDGKLLAMK